MPNKSRISPPPVQLSDHSSFSWTKWFNDIADMLGVSPLKIQAFSVAQLGTQDLAPERWGDVVGTSAFSSLVFVYDESGGATLAFSDGSEWRRLQDRAIIS